MPSPNTHTRLEDLITLFLKAGVDSYNSSDLTVSDTDTDQDTLGERARICLNLALQRIYALIKESKYLEAYPKTTLASTINQAFIDLDPEAELDDIEAITEQTSTQIRLVRRSWSWYRSNLPAPAQTTGDPTYYIRRGNRIYLAPTPSSVRTYTIDFRKYTGDLKLPSDLPLLPTQYNNWIVSEARVDWYMMEDPSSVPEQALLQQADARAAAIDSILNSYDKNIQAGSNCEGESLGAWPFQRPVGQ